MGRSQLVVRGIMKADGTVEIGTRLNWPPGAVRVTIEPLDPADRTGPSIVEVMEQIRRDQEARGYQGLSSDELEAVIAEIRDDEEYEESWCRIWAETDSSIPKADRVPM